MGQDSAVSGPPGEYKVSLTGPGTNLERTIPFDVFRRIIMLLYEMQGDQPPRVSHPSTAPAFPHEQRALAGEPSPSLREFLDRQGANTNPKKIAAVGAYRKTFGGENSFSPEELTQAFLDAGEPAPANLPRDIRKTVKNGWIARRPGEDDIYYVTGSGEKAIQANFQSTSKGGGKRRRRRTRRASSKPSS